MSTYLSVAKKFKVEMAFSDLYMAASSNRIDTATAEELGEIKTALGLNH